jgi:hypothetical protein
MRRQHPFSGSHMTEPNLSKDPKRIIYVGMLTTDHEAQKYREYSIAGNSYQNKFVCLSEPDEIINLKPLRLTDRSSRAIKYGFSLSRAVRLATKVLRYILYTTKTAFILYSLVKKRTEPVVIFYNVDYINWVLIALAEVLECKVVIIAADYVSPPRTVIDKLLLLPYRFTDGVIKLRRNNDFSGRHLLLTAVIDRNDGLDNLRVGARNVLYSGSIGYTTGLAVVIETASELPSVTFNISGPLYDISEEDFYEAIRGGSSKGANIIYHGVLTNEKYLTLLRDCEIAISMRNPENSDHHNNFPSKIAEYFNNSRCVISSIKYEVIPEDAYVYSEFTGECLSFIIGRLFDDECRLQNYGRRGFLFAQEEFSMNASSRKFRSFISGI